MGRKKVKRAARKKSRKDSRAANVEVVTALIRRGCTAPEIIRISKLPKSYVYKMLASLRLRHNDHQPASYRCPKCRSLIYTTICQICIARAQDDLRRLFRTAPLTPDPPKLTSEQREELRKKLEGNRSPLSALFTRGTE